MNRILIERILVVSLVVALAILAVEMATAAAPKTNTPAEAPVPLLSSNPPPAVVAPPPEPTVTVAQANAFADSMFVAGAKCALAIEVLHPEIRDVDGKIEAAKALFKSQR